MILKKATVPEWPVVGVLTVTCVTVVGVLTVTCVTVVGVLTVTCVTVVGVLTVTCGQFCVWFYSNPRRQKKSPVRRKHGALCKEKYMRCERVIQ